MNKLAIIFAIILASVAGPWVTLLALIFFGILKLVAYLKS